jgi:FkbM family methyltransferase
LGSLLLQKQPIFVDLGAQVGTYSEFFWNYYNSILSQIISVEPHPENIQKIKERINRCGASNRWITEECAVDINEGYSAFPFYRTAQGDPNGSLHLNEMPFSLAELSAFGWSVKKEEISVKTKKLSQICPNPSIVKIDVEGHEWVILPDILEMSSIYALIIEFTNMATYKLEDYLKMLWKKGYTNLVGHTGCDKKGWFYTLDQIPPTLRWEDLPDDDQIRKVMHVLAQRKKPEE